MSEYHTGENGTNAALLAGYCLDAKSFIASTSIDSGNSSTRVDRASCMKGKEIYRGFYQALMQETYGKAVAREFQLSLSGYESSPSDPDPLIFSKVVRDLQGRIVFSRNGQSDPVHNLMLTVIRQNEELASRVIDAVLKPKTYSQNIISIFSEHRADTNETESVNNQALQKMYSLSGKRVNYWKMYVSFDKAGMFDNPNLRAYMSLLYVGQAAIDMASEEVVAALTRSALSDTLIPSSDPSLAAGTVYKVTKFVDGMLKYSVKAEEERTVIKGFKPDQEELLQKLAFLKRGDNIRADSFQRLIQPAVLAVRMRNWKQVRSALELLENV